MSEKTKVEEIKNENDVKEPVTTTEPTNESKPEAPAKEPEVKKVEDDISVKTALKVIAKKAVVPILGVGAVIGVACGVCKKKTSSAYDQGYDDGGRAGYDQGYADGERNAGLIETSSEPETETQNE